MANQTITQQTNPWAPQQPYLERGFGYAQDLYNQGGPQYYQGNTVAPFGPQTNMAMQNYWNTATNNTGQSQALNQMMTNTLGGAYLPNPSQGGNPYTQGGLQGGPGTPAGMGQQDPGLAQYYRDMMSGQPYRPPPQSVGNQMGAGVAQQVAAGQQAPGMGGQYIPPANPQAPGMAPQAIGGNFGQNIPANPQMGPQVPGSPGGAAQPMGQGGQIPNSSNPYLQGAFDDAAAATTRAYSESVVPGIQAQFANSGRTGSGMYANALDQSRDTLSRNLGGMANNMFGGAYRDERNNQMRAAALAPSTMPMNYYDASQQLNIGEMRDQMAQRNINADYDRWNYNQNLPWDTAGRYQSMIQGNYGRQGSTTQPVYGPSTGQNVLGGAALGGALGNQFLGGWGGTAAGAGLGALGGWIFG